MAHNRCYRSLTNLLPEQPLHGALTIQYYIFSETVADNL